MSINEASATSERQAFSSVEVTKNTKGYSWACKVYVPIGDEDRLVPLVEALERELCDRYGGDE